MCGARALLQSQRAQGEAIQSTNAVRSSVTSCVLRPGVLVATQELPYTHSEPGPQFTRRDGPRADRLSIAPTNLGG